LCRALSNVLQLMTFSFGPSSDGPYIFSTQFYFVTKFLVIWGYGFIHM
jgi:hypothetical protein